LAPVVQVDFQDESTGEEKSREKAYGEDRQGGRYFRSTRSALVTVTDWNFNPSSVRWHILGKSGGYSIGSWHGEGKRHWCKIDFREDGRYAVGLSVSDYAGNSTAYKAGYAFTIDRTAPKLLLWMDQSDVSHKKYYSHAQIIYILVKEDNPSKDLIRLSSGKGPRKRIFRVSSPSLPFLREYDKRGWTIYSYTAGEEGSYRLSCYCEDKAGNRSDKKILSPFVVDKTPPRIDWQNLYDGITYTGRVALRLSVCDPHLDDSQCQVNLYYGDGSKATNLEAGLVMTGTRNRIKTCYCTDFPLEKKYDNRYLLKVSACDLAGNRPADQEMVFYVDRFGARYQLSEETKECLKNYYRNQEEDIQVTVFSLHPLSTDILVNYNKEDYHALGPEDYEEKAGRLTGREDLGDVQILPASYAGWYRTSYKIPGHVFSEEGDYGIVLRSREMEGSRQEEGKEDVLTESESILWTDPIEFAIDKTPPTVIIGGLEEDSYLADRKEYTVTALDNMRLKKVRLSVRKEEEGKGKSILLTEKDFEDNHSITSELTSCSGYQILGYDAWDYAGNKISAGEQGQEKKVLVTGSALCHYYNRYRVEIALGILILFLALIPGILLTGKPFFAIVKNKLLSKRGRQDGF
ncbi:MAG: hypothetical protein IKX76_06535, partial [Eubacterium sp.]|nr:hypothetical protein [Eubacterium sp.]